MSERPGLRVRLREPPGLKRAPVVRSGEAAVLHGWCRGCAYDLRGIHGPNAACPECGRGFVPGDESSYSRSARISEEHAVRRFIHRHGLKLVVLLFLAALWMNGLLPHAVRGQGGRLWAWGDWRFGQQRDIRGDGSEARLWWWAGELWSFEQDNGPRPVVKEGEPTPPPPGLAWEMRRTRAGEWTLKVHEAGVRFNWLNSVFNEMKKPGMFGILLNDPERERSAGPFEASGTKTRIMERIVDHYGCSPEPFLLRPDQPYVWLFDPVDRRLFPMATGAAELAGIHIEGTRAFGDTRLFIHPAEEGVPVQEPHEIPASWMPEGGSAGPEGAKR